MTPGSTTNYTEIKKTYTTLNEILVHTPVSISYKIHVYSIYVEETNNPPYKISDNPG